MSGKQVSPGESSSSRGVGAPQGTSVLQNLLDLGLRLTKRFGKEEQTEEAGGTGLQIAGILGLIAAFRSSGDAQAREYVGDEESLEPIAGRAIGLRHSLSGLHGR